MKQNDWLMVGGIVLVAWLLARQAAAQPLALPGPESGAAVNYPLPPGVTNVDPGTYGTPSTAGTMGTGNTNPLTALIGGVLSLFQAKTTAAGNAPSVTPLPAGPAGDITAAGGGTPGTVPNFGGVVDPWAYDSQYDTPWGYYDVMSGVFYPTE